MSIRSDATKLAVFVMVAGLSTVVVANTITDPVAGRTVTYHARFSDVTGLVTGSDVRIAGVRTGKVTDIDVTDQHDALVTFEVSDTQRLPADTTAAIRYADLLGARNLTLIPTTNTDPALPAQALIPIERTIPSVDLSAVLGGFRPLFDALDPAVVNRVAGEIIDVFEGQNTSIDSLLLSTITIADSIGQRSQIIDQLVTDLAAVLGDIAAQSPRVTHIVDTLASVMDGLERNRDLLTSGLDSIEGLSSSTNALVQGLSPDLAETTRSLDGATGAIIDKQDALVGLVDHLDGVLAELGALTSYGGWLNLYFCNLSLSAFGVELAPTTSTRSQVCR
ncbi:MCE-family protein Mce1B [Rhodococcus sp. B7740]|uniref:MCE family protein n=1 Tax=Rhodococcus sp. B7740 TaxID=1564114 RepID=UPI0005D7EAF3|nr:MlaD family protein [Rhodococcus sp. B7740]AJW40235.1 MCE-family protein Mce1B [Rhodococcus sp. B7740]